MFETRWEKCWKLQTHAARWVRACSEERCTCNDGTGNGSESPADQSETPKAESKSEWEIIEKQAEEAISKGSTPAPAKNLLKWFWASVHAVDGSVCLGAHQWYSKSGKDEPFFVNTQITSWKDVLCFKFSSLWGKEVSLLTFRKSVFEN